MSIGAYTIDDGGMVLGPIPGDMLRVVESKPQVYDFFLRFSFYETLIHNSP